MGSQLLQQALILQQALTSLRERFVRLGRKGRLRAVLVETPVFVHTPGSGLGGVPGSRGKFVWVWSRAYREPAIRVDATGNPVVIATAFVDVQGNPQLNDEGRPIDFSDCGAVRVVQLEGDNTIWDQFKELAADAGHVLETAPSSIRDRFPHETLGLNEPPLRWLCASLTLHGHGYLDRHCLLRPTNRYGSRSTLTWPNLIHSLVICLRKSSTISPTPVRADLCPGTGISPSRTGRDFVTEHSWRDAIRGVTDPPEWFSTLADVVQASVYAIDVLLADIEAEVEEQGTHFDFTAPGYCDVTASCRYSESGKAIS